MVGYNNSKIFKIINSNNSKLIFIGGSTQPLTKKFYDLKRTPTSPFYKYVKDNFNGDFTHFNIIFIEDYNATDKYDLESKVLEVVLTFDKNNYILINDIQTNINNTEKDKFKLWANKQIMLMGEEKFKETRNEYYKKYYQDNFKKPDDIKKEKEKLPIIKPYKSIDLSKFSNKPLFTPSTIKQYTFIIKLIYKHYNKKDIDLNNEIFKFINNNKYKSNIISSSFKFLKKNIKDIITSFPQYINSLYSIFIHINGFKVVIKHLAPYKDYINNEYYNKRNDYKPSDEVINKISFNKNDVLELLTKFSHLNNKTKLIFGLYTLLPTKRPKDYRIIKIINTNPELDENIDTSFNYLYKNDDNIIQMYFYNMKVNKRDVIIIKLPEELYPFVDLKQNYLFQYCNTIYSSNGLSKLITNTFNKIYKYPFNPTMIRKLYTTYIKNIDINEKKEIAKIMNQSLEQQLLYAY